VDRSIKIHFMNGESTIIIVTNVKIGEDGIIRFVRIINSKWCEVLAAPRESVRSWG
jgi:hypothetical protein